MKATKTIFAIFALILAGFGLLQGGSIFSLFSDGMQATISISFSLLIASVIGLVAKNSTAGNIIAAIFYLMGYFDGVDVETVEIYRDTLDLYTYFSLISAVIFFIGAFCIEEKNTDAGDSNKTKEQEKSNKSKNKGGDTKVKE